MTMTAGQNLSGSPLDWEVGILSMCTELCLSVLSTFHTMLVVLKNLFLLTFLKSVMTLGAFASLSLS